MDHGDKRTAHGADITYGTKQRIRFDYLRDNMAFRRNSVQRGPHYAIVDEVDSILIDEARTPLIISRSGGGIARSSYVKINAHRALERARKEDAAGDFWVDEKQKQVHLTEEGMEHGRRAAAPNRSHRRG